MKKITFIIAMIFSSYNLSAQYQLHSSVFGGGATSSGGTYIVRGSVSQTNVGLTEGIGYSMKVGFWAGYRYKAFMIPTISTTAAGTITVNSASSGGNISNAGSSAVTASGIVYATTSNPAIGGPGVTQVVTNPLVETGAFTSALSGLSINTRYYIRAYATNTSGTSYGNEVSFYTLANAPSAPTVNNATSTTLGVAINANGNPAATEYAIRIGANYVQDDGTLSGSIHWKTKANWEINVGNTVRTVTGLTPNTQYTVAVIARNGANTETAFSGTTSLRTLAAVPTAPTVNGATTNALNVAINANGNPAGTEFAIHETGTNNYIQLDGTLSASAVWQTEAQWEINAINTAKTVSGLSANTQYTFQVKARNATPTETTFGATSALYTLANVPAAPTVNTPSPSSLNVAVNANGNPVATEFAIREIGGNYVQADGSLAGGAIWQTAAAWGTTTVTGLTAATSYTFDVIARNGNSVNTVYSSTTALFTLSAEPTNHATAFAASNPTALSIDITWTDASAGTLPDGYIVKAATGNYGNIAAPVDGVVENDAILVKNIAQGVQTVQFTGLNSNTQYYFKIYPYKGAATTRNYKTDGVVPSATNITLIAYPSTQASNIQFSNITRTGMTVRWAKGDGEGSLLLAKEQYRIANTPLTDGVVYDNPNTNYTSAPTVGGAKLLYNGTDANPSINVTGLTRYKLYYFRAFAYNNVSSPYYLQTENATNPRSRWTLRRDGMMDEDLTIDAEYAYPNPATYSISTTLDMFEAGTVSAKLYDAAGRVATELYNQSLPFGTHELKFDISNVQSGVYQLIISKGSEAIVYPVSVVK